MVQAEAQEDKATECKIKGLYAQYKRSGQPWEASWDRG